MNYTEIQSKMAELREQRKTQAKSFFTQAAKDLFDQYSDLHSFSWNQYTPYFNDGDECTFGVNTWSIQYNGFDEDDEDEESLFAEMKLPSKPTMKAIRDFIQVFDEDDLKELFGDHSEITIHRDGTIDIEEYEHD